MEYKDLFKSRIVPSLAESLAKRCQSAAAERQEKRREFFWGAAVLPEATSSNKREALEKKKNSRAEKLKEWKAEKMRLLKEAKKKQKPVFKVGVVQRKATGSPVFSQLKTYKRHNLVSKQSQVKPPASNLTETSKGVLTRAAARAKNITVKCTDVKEVNSVTKTERKYNKFCKIDENKRKQLTSHVFKVPEAVSKLPGCRLTLPYSPKLMRKTKKSGAVKEKGGKVKPPEREEDRVPEEDLGKENIVEEEEVQAQVTTPEQDDFRPIHYSPFVTVRSGKKSKSPRKSKKKLTMDVEEQIKKEEKEFECRIFSFRKFIDCESKRLGELCRKWKFVYEEFEELPAEAEGDIDAAIGKTNLLTSDKFNQFKGLIEKCENGDPFVKVDDLQGFQDWVAIEVERVDEEFHRLERRKCNNWAPEPAPEPAPSQPEKRQPLKPPKNPPKRPPTKSNIRSHILAARKMLKEGNASGGEALQLPTSFPEEAEKVKTPKREQSLLREVLDPEAKTKSEASAKKFPALRERQNSGLEIMVATQKNKCPTPLKLQKSPVLQDYEVFVGDDKTPNRSILKKTPKKSNSSKAHVKFKKVAENVVSGRKGLSEKYFQPVEDSEGESPMRTVLGDLANLAGGGVRTRSKAKQWSYSAAQSPQYTCL